MHHPIGKTALGYSGPCAQAKAQMRAAPAARAAARKRKSYMLLYITLGTNDLGRAKQFYDAVMPCLGFVLQSADASEIGYGPPGGAQTPFGVTLPFDGQKATSANGSMPAFEASSRAAVDAFYAAALAHGGASEGAPGLRPYGANFYACYVRGPDGHKLSAVCVQTQRP